MALITFSQLIVVSVLKKNYFFCSLFVCSPFVVFVVDIFKADGDILRLSLSAVFLGISYGCRL